MRCEHSLRAFSSSRVPNSNPGAAWVTMGQKRPGYSVLRLRARITGEEGVAASLCCLFAAGAPVQHADDAADHVRQQLQALQAILADVQIPGGRGLPAGPRPTWAHLLLRRPLDQAVDHRRGDQGDVLQGGCPLEEGVGEGVQLAVRVLQEDLAARDLRDLGPGHLVVVLLLHRGELLHILYHGLHLRLQARVDLHQLPQVPLHPLRGPDLRAARHEVRHHLLHAAVPLLGRDLCLAPARPLQGLRVVGADPSVLPQQHLHHMEAVADGVLQRRAPSVVHRVDLHLLRERQVRVFVAVEQEVDYPQLLLTGRQM
mmetsp:Transcript_38475/g.99943  ORF Transcript_38475/g.99943 Transcript_38475/m.99943 type:complete len:314 (-) Transcript_38475:7-948(-)